MLPIRRPLLAFPLLLVTPAPAGPLQDADELPPFLEMETRGDRQGRMTLEGIYRVWENRERATGRLLELHFVVLMASGENPRPDPIFFLAGGPGQAASTLASGRVDSWMRRDRDLVFVDQRGTAGNHALRCSASGNDSDLQGYFDPLMRPENFRACLEELQRKADLTQYSTPIAMDDMDEVREILGYGQFNLVGGSYGTRASLVYMRRHPDRVRAALLNGVAPMAFTNPLYHAAAAQEGLERVFEECAADPTCSGLFPDLAEEVAELFERLDAEPARVTLPHPTTGEPVEIRLTRDAFAEALRVLLYYTPTNRQVPLMVHRAHEGDYTPFATAALRSNRNLRTILAMGMLLCVTCAEDLARIDPESIPGATDGTFLGDVRVRGQLAVCAFWPHSDLPQGYGESVRCEAPTLLLSGTHDPVTPPRWGAEAASHLPNSLHLVVPGAHGVGGPCVDSIVADFLERASVGGLDTGCVETMRMPPFQSPQRR